MRESNLKNLTKLMVILVLSVALLLTKCAEKEPKEKGDDLALPPSMSNTADITISILPDSVSLMADSLFTQVEYNSEIVQAIGLDYFIATVVQDESKRNLYSYNQIASDGFTPRNSSNGGTDLFYNQFSTGYLLQGENLFRTYFPAIDVSAWNVKNIRKIELYRTISVVKPDGENVVFYLNLLTTHNITNQNNEPEPAKKLTDLITPYITTSPNNYIYHLYAADGRMSAVDFTWEHIQDGYYLMTQDRSYFPNFNLSGQYRWSDVVKITLTGTGE